MLDLVRADQHAAIRLGTGDWPGSRARSCSTSGSCRSARRRSIAKHGPLKRREESPAIRSCTAPASRGRRGYSREAARHSRNAGLSMISCKETIDDTTSPFTGTRIDDSAAVVRQALQGRGLALARWSLAGDDVAAGRLVVASEAAQLLP